VGQARRPTATKKIVRTTTNFRDVEEAKTPRAAKRRTKGEGGIYYDAERKRWRGEVWIDGRRHRVSGRTKTDCAAALGRLIHGDPAERTADRRSTVGQLLADWQTKALANRTLAPSTRDTHAWAATLLTTELGRVRLAELDVHAVERALGRLAAKRNLSRASLIKIRSTLRQALAWAQKRRAISHNPAAVAELPTDLEQTDARFALDAKQLRALFRVCRDHPYGAMFVLMGTIGLRPGEAAGICYDAVDFDAGTLTVRRAVQLEHGRPVLVEELKTTASRRTIRLPAVALEALRGSSGTAVPNVDGLLFTAPHGGPLWPSTVRRELRQLCADAGVPKIRPNELRHSAATLMADAGVPLHRIADVLGQVNTRMLDQTYRHRPPVVDDADVIDEVFGSHDAQR
jgi:integrase